IGGTYSGPGVINNGVGFDPLSAGGVGSYQITYTYTNENGCTNSAANTITVVGIPSAPGAISGPALAICANTTNSYNIASVSGATSYTWIAPTDASILSGQRTNSVTVSFGSLFTSGDLAVMANNDCGSTSSSIMTITSVPATPI